MPAPFKQTLPSLESNSRLLTACYCHISQFLILSNWVMTTPLLTDTSTARSVQSVAGFTLRNQVYPTRTAALATGAILKSNKSNSGKQTCARTVVLVRSGSCREFMMHSCAPRELWNHHRCSAGTRMWVLTEAPWCISAQTITLNESILQQPCTFPFNSSLDLVHFFGTKDRNPNWLLSQWRQPVEDEGSWHATKTTQVATAVRLRSPRLQFYDCNIHIPRIVPFSSANSKGKNCVPGHNLSHFLAKM